MPTEKSKKFLADRRVYEPGDPVVAIEQTVHHFPGVNGVGNLESDPPEDIASPPVLVLDDLATGYLMRVRVTPDLARTLVSVLLDHLWDSSDPAPYVADLTERVQHDHVLIVRELLGPTLIPYGHETQPPAPLRLGIEEPF